MNLPDITPLVLTFNEAPNIVRCLERLRWAQHVLVLDSFSQDETLSLARQFPNVIIVQRAFDTFAGQCNHGLSLIDSAWVLSLDCDYILGAGFEEELRGLPADGSCDGWRAAFRYCIHGRPLSSCLYPPRCVLYRKDKARYEDEGHGHRVRIDGTVLSLRSTIDHDDRKPLGRWFASQIKYAEREAAHLLAAPAAELSRVDRLRLKMIYAPAAVFVYVMLARRALFDGWPGWYYAFQRTIAELMLSVELLERRLRHD